MTIANRHGVAIGSIEEWETLAAPASYKHWKPDRSAYELARAWLDGEGLAAVQRVLRNCVPALRPREIVAEAQTRFDAFGGPRNHDLLIVGDDVIVAVEAKVDEAFDRTLAKYRADAERRRAVGKGTNAPERLNGLLAALVAPGRAAPEALRFQLFSATGGALAEASNRAAGTAVVLIHEFVTPLSNERKRADNAQDLADFLRELFGVHVPTAREWCVGPFRVPGSDRIPGDVDLYFAKAVTSTQASAFARWAHRWLELGRYTGRDVPDVDERSAAIEALWDEPVPGGEWKRGPDKRILDPAQRYCRTHGAGNRPRGEHAIEHDVLRETPLACFGQPLVDGVNAVPLARDSGGGRSGNVEADMLLLVGEGDRRRQLLVEVKDNANDAWFALVENLRQLRLFADSEHAQAILRSRRPELGLADDLPLEGVVLAPLAFFTGRGRKAAAVEPALELARRLQPKARIHLATWDPDARVVAEWDG
jgi:hypothetical protein